MSPPVHLAGLGPDDAFPIRRVRATTPGKAGALIFAAAFAFVQILSHQPSNSTGWSFNLWLFSATTSFIALFSLVLWLATVRFWGRRALLITRDGFLISSPRSERLSLTWTEIADVQVAAERFKTTSRVWIIPADPEAALLQLPRYRHSQLHDHWKAINLKFIAVLDDFYELPAAELGALLLDCRRQYAAIHHQPWSAPARLIKPVSGGADGSSITGPVANLSWSTDSLAWRVVIPRRRTADVVFLAGLVVVELTLIGAMVALAIFFANGWPALAIAGFVAGLIFVMVLAGYAVARLRGPAGSFTLTAAGVSIVYPGRRPAVLTLGWDEIAGVTLKTAGRLNHTVEFIELNCTTDRAALAARLPGSGPLARWRRRTIMRSGVCIVGPARPILDVAAAIDDLRLARLESLSGRARSDHTSPLLRPAEPPPYVVHLVPASPDAQA